jgi:hypothetical protein
MTESDPGFGVAGRIPWLWRLYSRPGQTPKRPKQDGDQDRCNHHQGEYYCRCGCSHRVPDQILTPAAPALLQMRCPRPFRFAPQSSSLSFHSRRRRIAGRRYKLFATGCRFRVAPRFRTGWQGTEPRDFAFQIRGWRLSRQSSRIVLRCWFMAPASVPVAGVFLFDELSDVPTRSAVPLPAGLYRLQFLGASRGQRL